MITVHIDCVNGDLLSLTTVEGKARAFRWLQENDHEGAHISVEVSHLEYDFTDREDIYNYLDGEVKDVG
jgi:hypothetical protein